MTFPSQDYLQRPPHIEKQTTKDDMNYMATAMTHELLTQIRDELCRMNPTVLCATDVQGGPLLNVAGEDRTIKFLSSGKPVTVYKVLLWTQSAIAVRASVVGMSNGGDGFSLTNNLTILEVPVSEMTLAINAAGAVGVNVPSNINANGSVFVYGFTNPHYLNKEY